MSNTDGSDFVIIILFGHIWFFSLIIHSEGKARKYSEHYTFLNFLGGLDCVWKENRNIYIKVCKKKIKDWKSELLRVINGI